MARQAHHRPCGPIWRVLLLYGWLGLLVALAPAACTLAWPASSPGKVPLRIHTIQGAGHLSPLFNSDSGIGQLVDAVPGIVTVVRPNGFYLQEPVPDGDEATSEAIFVFTGTAPGRAVGDALLVSGPVHEFRPGGNGGLNNLTITQIGHTDAPAISQLVAAGQPLPAPLRIGQGGRQPPRRVIDDDSRGTVEAPSTIFDPEQDGIDFYESLEGMLVEVDQAVAVGPTNRFGETPVLADNGRTSAAAGRSLRGGLVITAADVHPERIIVDDTLTPNPPRLNVGDRYSGPLIGVIDYSFGNFKLLQSRPWPAPISGGLQRERTTLVPVTVDQLTIASFNVENLDPKYEAIALVEGRNASNVDDDVASGKVAALAAIVVTHLAAPDIVAVEEIQDNDGAEVSGTVDASQTYTLLIEAIRQAGGPVYQYRQIDPGAQQDGGQPGGNIRVGLLFRTDRGLSFVDRPGGGAQQAVEITIGPDGPHLTTSPGRIAPGDPAFRNSRKPLVGEFLFNGRCLFVIANHFSSKGGDQPLFGRYQPPTAGSEPQRRQQAARVADFVGRLLALDAQAAIVVLGDLNDFEFSASVGLLKAAGLISLIETLPQAERYTYIFEGNGQVLDHIMVSPALLRAGVSYDIVHVNSEFVDPWSDHDPSVARLTLPAK